MNGEIGEKKFQVIKFRTDFAFIFENEWSTAADISLWPALGSFNSVNDVTFLSC